MAQGAGEDIADNLVWQYAEEGSNTEAQEVEFRIFGGNYQSIKQLDHGFGFQWLAIVMTSHNLCAFHAARAWIFRNKPLI